MLARAAAPAAAVATVARGVLGGRFMTAIGICALSWLWCGFSGFSWRLSSQMCTGCM